MRNQRGSFVPLPIKPAKSIPKPLEKLPSRKCASVQTERVLLITEENLNFGSWSWTRYRDGRMERDYLKALNHINSCHSLINTFIKKDKSYKRNQFLLPTISNFAPFFPQLIGKRVCKKKEHPEVKKIAEKVSVYSNKTTKSDNKNVCKKNEYQEIRNIPEKVSVHSNKTGKSDNRSVCKKIDHQEFRKIPEKVSVRSNKTGKSDNRKSKSAFGIKKQETAIVDPAPVSNFNKKMQAQESVDRNLTNDITEQTQQFFNTLHNDMIKTEKRLTKHKCEYLDIVTNRLEQLLYLQTIAAGNSSQILTITNLPPPPLPPPYYSLQVKDAESSIIQSDTDCSDHEFHPIECEEKPSFSSISSSSYIKSDSDIEINEPYL